MCDRKLLTTCLQLTSSGTLMRGIQVSFVQKNLIHGFPIQCYSLLYYTKNLSLKASQFRWLRVSGNFVGSLCYVMSPEKVDVKFGEKTLNRLNKFKVLYPPHHMQHIEVSRSPRGGARSTLSLRGRNRSNPRESPNRRSRRSRLDANREMIQHER